ncbi:MAG: hypothetical protein AAF922_14770 [Pseudomonadota bacterium]
MSYQRILKPDPLAWCLRGLIGKASPSADLYVANPCSDLLVTGKLVRLTPTVFRAGDALVVVRHALDLEQPQTFSRLIYVIDDDWRAGLQSPALPMSYRFKMRWVEKRAARSLEPLSDLIVTSSHVLEARLRKAWPTKAVAHIHPVWPEFSRPHSPPSDTIRLAYLSSWSHRKDFELVAGPLYEILEAHPDVSLTLTTQAGATSRLASHPRVDLVPAMDWEAYKKWLAQQRFDIGIYCLHETEFNLARSLNKIFEYTIAGAAVLVSDHLAEIVTSSFDQAVKCVGPTPGHWQRALEDLISNPKLRSDLHARSIRAVEGAGIKEKTYEFWQDALGPRQGQDKPAGG